MRWAIFVAAAVIGLTLDLGTKTWAFAQESLWHPYAHIPVVEGWFDIALSKNPGAAWGLLAGRHTFFLIISVAAFLAITYFVHTAPKTSKLGPIVLGLVLAGVSGNFYDRCAEGVVRASALDWTIVYPPALTDGPATDSYRHGEQLQLRGRASIAAGTDRTLRAADPRATPRRDSPRCGPARARAGTSGSP